MRKTIVRWQKWHETWRHIGGYSQGVYTDYSQEFSSYDEARGFASGLRQNPYVQDVRVE